MSVSFRLAITFLIMGTPALAEKVSQLPLEPGYYVSADTNCGDASNATLTLVTKTGINVSQAACTFLAIDQQGPTIFSVTDNCIELSSGTALGEAVTLYDIPNDKTYAPAGGTAARFCAQTDLPEPWRSNDITDLIK